jgi:hypothetical protein
MKGFYWDRNFGRTYISVRLFSEEGFIHRTIKAKARV